MVIYVSDYIDFLLNHDYYTEKNIVFYVSEISFVRLVSLFNDDTVGIFVSDDDIVRLICTDSSAFNSSSFKF